MRVRYWCIGGVAAAALGLVPGGAGAPLDETYQFPSAATAEIEVFGAKETVSLTGPTVVRRGERMGDTIPTEMIQLDLQGTTTLLGGGIVVVRAGSGFDLPQSTGQIDTHVDRNGNFVFGQSTFTIKGARFSFFPQRGNAVHGDVADVTVGSWISKLPPNVPVTTPLVIPKLDHFKCYQLKVESGFKSKTVALADEFEPEQAKLQKPVSLCTPVSKNRAPIRERRVHLKCYTIQSTSENPKKAELPVEVTNQFGAQTLVVKEPQTLCAPSLKARVVKGRAALPRLDPGRLLDHFKCYAATAKEPLQPRTVRLDDQFEVESARVLQVRRLCNVVDKNREGVRDGNAHLVCYGIKDTSRKLKPGGRTVVVQNQFGKEKLVVRGPESLCLPSAKKPPCSEYAERAKAALTVNGQQVGSINNAIHIPFKGEPGSPCE